MATALKTMLVLMFAWIATMWPTAWTALLMLMALSAMFLGMALERYFSSRRETTSVKRTSTAFQQ